MEPYRLLFPLGILFAISGALVWPLYALGWIPYPGALHRALMIEGFELSFVLGFLLTAMPAFTHGQRCRPLELALAVATLALFGALSLMSDGLAAQAVIVIALALPLIAIGRRVARAPVPPPEEFLFVGFGLLCGIAGAVFTLAGEAGLWIEPVPRLGIRLLSLGMVLSLVLGLGGLLVPTFTGMTDPLVIPGIARAHERRPRRALYLTLIVAFASAFAYDAFGHAGAGAIVRAAAASVLALWVWKIYRLPGRRDMPAFSMWGAGWMIFAGLWLAALAPSHALAGEHFVFIGGFGFLTLGIGTRVVVSHGRHGLAAETRLLTPIVASALALALTARAFAEWAPAFGVMPLYAASGALWAVAWLLWGSQALPRIARVVSMQTPPHGMVQISKSPLAPGDS